MGMSEGVYCSLKNVSWESFHCGVPSFSTSLFDTTIFETSNSFTYLNETSNTEASDLSFSNPIATSSPAKISPGRTDLPLRVLVINCQSIKSPGKPPSSRISFSQHGQPFNWIMAQPRHKIGRGLPIVIQLLQKRQTQRSRWWRIPTSLQSVRK